MNERMLFIQMHLDCKKKAILQQFGLERKEIFKWSFKVNYLECVTDIAGTEPIVLWKEIFKIMKDTAQDFPGIQLKLSYLCPGCILELCLLEPLKNLPGECETMFSEGEQTKDIYACQRKFHKATRQQIKEGFSKQSKYFEKKKVEGKLLFLN